MKASGQTGSSESRDSAATRLLEVIEDADEIDFFLIPAGECFVTFPRKQDDTSIMETAPIDSGAFSSYLRRKYRQYYGELCPTEAVNTVIAYLSGEATQVKMVFIRIAHHGGKIYVDTANSLRQCIEISPEIERVGWQIIEADKCPVKFWLTKGYVGFTLA